MPLLLAFIRFSSSSISDSSLHELPHSSLRHEALTALGCRSTPPTMKWCVLLTSGYLQGMENKNVGHKRTTRILESATAFCPSVKRRACMGIAGADSRRAANYWHFADPTSCQDCLVESCGSMYSAGAGSMSVCMTVTEHVV